MLCNYNQATQEQMRLDWEKNHELHLQSVYRILRNCVFHVFFQQLQDHKEWRPTHRFSCDFPVKLQQQSITKVSDIIRFSTNLLFISSNQKTCNWQQTQCQQNAKARNLSVWATSMSSIVLSALLWILGSIKKFGIQNGT